MKVTKIQMPKGMTKEQKEIWKIAVEVHENREKDMIEDREEKKMIQEQKAAITAELKTILGTDKFTLDQDFDVYPDDDDLHILDFKKGANVAQAIAKAITSKGVKMYLGEGFQFEIKVGKRKFGIEINE